MYEQDYIMRLIKEMIKFIAKIFFHKDEISYELSNEDEYSQTDYLYKELLVLIELGKINEAENLLFEKLDENNNKYIELVLDFYNRLNNLDDDFLEENNFSREEIAEGLKDMAKEFGLQNNFPFLE
ncbi:DUF6483 family protein [Clostridium sp. Cult2]|uniref:DUF6483 family protein n=1 Tax=Clostridium sp. Cult2 TaxID=2079003 RepID=UPI001F35C62B|nr:DUF6483 family protein [Clostridium sp. Cult2]MCF6464526.1 hypothetical protein [Clostridium sp. Cult2]